MYDDRQIILKGLPTTAIEPYLIVAHAPTAGQIKQAIATDAAIGILSDKAAAAGDLAKSIQANYVIHGPHRVRLGGTVVEGAWLKANASGKAIAAVANDAAIGRALKGGVADDLIDVFVQPYKV
jgi:hypothetical protein